MEARCCQRRLGEAGRWMAQAPDANGRFLSFGFRVDSWVWRGEGPDCGWLRVDARFCGMELWAYFGIENLRRRI